MFLEGLVVSFWEVWNNKPQLVEAVLNPEDQYEAVWDNQKRFNYKIATTFMPGYAKAIYDFFKAETVLDPCAGWGDRLTGAAASSIVKKYVAFDPNRNLRYGYSSIMKQYGIRLGSVTDSSLYFDNSFQIHTLPFEVNSPEHPESSIPGLKEGSFDLVFTSPPFFDYEMYNDKTNPQYRDWIQEFYVPLMKLSAKFVKDDGHVLIHIGDTSAGVIVPFLTERVHHIAPLTLVHKIGLLGNPNIAEYIDCQFFVNFF